MTPVDLHTVVSTAAAAANFLKKPIQDVSGKIIQDGYEHLKKLISEKTKGSAEVSEAFAKLEQKPDSKARADVLNEELVDKGIEEDADILAAVEVLLTALPSGCMSQVSHV